MKTKNMAFSRVKTVVHPDYARFEEFVRRLPQEDFPIDRVFCDRRNTVIATHDQGVPMVVKKYARPTLFNCFVYTFFRPSKGVRLSQLAALIRRYCDVRHWNLKRAWKYFLFSRRSLCRKERIKSKFKSLLGLLP